MCWQECGENKMLIHCWWQYRMVQQLWKIVWRFLKELKIKLLYDRAFPLVGKQSKEMK